MRVRCHLHFAESLMKQHIVVRLTIHWLRVALEISPTCSMSSCSSQCFSAVCCRGRLRDSARASAIRRWQWLVLKLMEWTGANWWLWAAAVVIAFQLLMLLVAPAVIIPLFNKFTPLPEGTLRQRLFALAQRTDFPARSIEVMDGSKRSRHSNAFFTGFGRFRKIVLFDTLVAQLSEPELESVLAHEIGHYKKRHVIKLLGLSIAGVFVAFAVIAWLAHQQWFYRAFGFEYQPGFAAANLVPAMLLFALLAETISFS